MKNTRTLTRVTLVATVVMALLLVMGYVGIRSPAEGLGDEGKGATQPAAPILINYQGLLTDPSTGQRRARCHVRDDV